MEKAHELKFESPSFFTRLKGMLGVDFYRLFHTPMYYIFLAIAAIIPAMILSMTTMETPDGATPMYTNTWQVIAADTPLYVVSNIAEYANMNMVFIFGGIMVSIFSSFFLGTGIVIIGAAAIVGNSSVLNIFLYGSSVNACLSSNILTLIICIVVSLVWAVIYNVLGTKILSKCDVY